MYAASPAAVRPTTARFMRDGPGPTGPRNPAVPNWRKPLNELRNSASFLFSNQVRSVAAVIGSGSNAIQLSTSATSAASIIFYEEPFPEADPSCRRQPCQPPLPLHDSTSHQSHRPQHW